ncbi:MULTISPECIES: sensor histidine kinase [Nostocales]|uniref:CHASE2 domain-containing protein n=3 Tax=Nostocales TaxID=1161 RepID=A0A8S9TB52_9CYAN|nr:CHASE2 domain-containing protein [Tolypothrix bouteillei]KAF3889277.1 CHASE2 domain-containing protein [Tolypothrix bouteillei VB521301]
MWNKIEQQAKIWRTAALPGLVVVGCIAIARLTGSLQILEWIAFDKFLQLRPVEAPDGLITIVGINETDIKAVGKYPIPDRDLAKLLQIIQSHRPRAIGLDLFRDLNSAPDRVKLGTLLRSNSNIIGIEAALASQSDLRVKPPPELPSHRVALADIILDDDGKLRRGLLSSRVDDGRIKYSLPLLLAQMYLRSQGIAIKHGTRADNPIQFGDTQLPRFETNTGSYVGANAGGNQILLNFYSHPHPFSIVSLTDVFTGKVKPELIRDRIVIVGMTASNSVNDTFMTSATKSTLLTDAIGNSKQYQLIYGVEYLAHATSQIINAVLKHRPHLHTWSEVWEYLWIFAWGLLGIILGLLLQSPWKTLLTLALCSLCLIGICYGLIILSWWVPIVPTLLALCAAGLTTSLFDRDSRILLEQRSLTLKRTYDAVHNGPLQTIAAILRSLDEEPSYTKMRSQLQSLNQELRSVYELMNKELSTGNNRYIQASISELLYEVYDNTLKRELPGFDSIKTYIPPDFSPLQDCTLTAEQKQGLCIFMEEALCNVGKHALDASCLDVVCTRSSLAQGVPHLSPNLYTLQIIDNGINSIPNENPKSGRGTYRAKELARSLGGKFQRRSHVPQGVICELTWREITPWWRLLFRKTNSKTSKGNSKP